jgi:hypothetical protein
LLVQSILVRVLILVFIFFSCILSNFSSLGLTGSIPARVFKLASLKVLNLFNNSLVGSVPLELSNFTSLEELYVFSFVIPASLSPLLLFSF